ncbi:hypothetical protein ACFU99_05900 [Streptomyces sp. NPDC057654]|uniref:hypothetical protein n=1 Tax=Streptomyces sp. NPDC057654 TaxID=3346196 RepID=UPI00369D0DFF
MPVKDTHSYEKTARDVMSHFWMEEDERLSTQFRLDNETDSVTFIVSARTKGIRGPSVETEAGMRFRFDPGAGHAGI